MEGIVSMEAFCGNRSVKDNFWNYQLTVNTSSPDLTNCFQGSALSYVPLGYLLLCSLFYVPYLASKQTVNKWLQTSRLNTTKVGICILLLGIHVVCLAYSTIAQMPMVYPICFGVLFLTTLLVLLLIRYEYVKGEHSSGILFCYWLIVLVAGIVPFRSITLQGKARSFLGISFFIIYFLTLMLFLLHLVSDKSALPWYSCMEERKAMVANNSERDTERQPLLSGSGKQKSLEISSPELVAPFWSKITFSWCVGLLKTGLKGPVTEDDLWSLRPQDRTKPLIKRFYTCWRKVGQKCVASRKEDRPQKYRTFGNAEVTCSDKKNEEEDITAIQESHHDVWAINSNLASSLCRAFGIYYCLLGAYEIAILVLTYLRPVVLEGLIDYLESSSAWDWQGYSYAVLLFLLNAMRTLLTQQSNYGRFITGMRVRSGLTAAIYRKSLCLSAEARNDYSAGQIGALMSVDAQRVADAIYFLHYIWTSPISIAVAIYLLWQSLGPSAMAGFAVILVLMLINLFITSLSKKFQMGNMLFKDKRVRVLNEVFNGIKVIKLYAWEEAFMRRIFGIREDELINIRRSSYCHASMALCFNCTPIVFAVVTFTVYILTSGQTLTPQVAFVTLTITTSMNWSLAYLPMGIASVVQALVSIRRMQAFLNASELDPCSVQRKAKECMSDNTAIGIETGNFSWSVDETPVLTGIDLKVKKGSLTMVVGHVGSGKSSLVSAILGEMIKLQGRVTVSGEVSYVPQEAWIRNQTLEKNILFEKTKKTLKYHEVTEACALVSDLEQLPAGDQTEIGEKGINLSGGQKQRVSLARAVYQDRDIYLLDDPLSAVDAHVGKHIFSNVIGSNGLLRNKTRLLVTHGLSYLPHSDLIVVLREGRISEVGSYQELISRNGELAALIRNYLNEESDDTEDDSDERSVREDLRRQISALSEMQPTSDYSSSQCSHSHRFLRRRNRNTESKRSLAGSITATATRMQPPSVSNQKLIEKEQTETGRVKFKVAWKYLEAMGWPIVCFFLLLFSINIGLDLGANIWLSEWSDDSGCNNSMSSNTRLEVYAGIGGAQALVVLTQSILLAVGCSAASRVLHERVLSSILHAPMSFFDTTPLGRLMNRFTQDFSIVDSAMRMNIYVTLRGSLVVITSGIAITYTTPIFAAVLVPLVIVFHLVQKFYIVTSNQLRRLLSIHTSPIYSHFEETIQGATSIRAYNEQDTFIAQSDRLVDKMQMAKYPSLATNRWLSICLEFLGSSTVLFTSLYVVIAKDSVTGGAAGLAISYALQVTERIAMLVQNICDMENNIVSAERIMEYTDVPSEASWVKEGFHPPHDWPREGAIGFQCYGTRYRPGLDLVLKGIDLILNPNEKLGVVGRTGAGKSSLMLGLFRLIEPAQGCIKIDSWDISMMGLHDLRSKLTIIPQDPVLFSGTLRTNFDPFEQYSDEEIWKALEHAHLKNYVACLPGRLQHMCSEGGQNLSVGQRQLVCLTRALLRKSRVLVLDEATAAVDVETDELIQATIRTEFKDSTVLTIAHRLNTVLDYDRILVLADGKVKELASPSELLKNENGTFYSMAQQAGLI